MAEETRGDTPEARAALIEELQALMRADTSVATARDLVGRLDALAAADPETFAQPLAFARLRLAGLLRDAGEHDEAVRVGWDSFTTFKQLADDSPTVETIANAALCLLALTDLLGEIGAHEKAVGTASEGTRLYDTLASEIAPGRFKPELLHAMLVYQDALSAAGEHAVAHRIVDQGISLALQLSADEFAAAGDDVYEMAHHYGRLCYELGHTVDEDRYDRVLARLVAAGLLDLETDMMAVGEAPEGEDASDKAADGEDAGDP